MSRQNLGDSTSQVLLVIFSHMEVIHIVSLAFKAREKAVTHFLLQVWM